jgi:serine/threonine protein phosphatase 1
MSAHEVVEISDTGPAAPQEEPPPPQKEWPAGVSSKRQKFALLKAARRVWAIASIHGEAGRLETLHHELGERLKPGDRVVYMGNMLGRGQQVHQTINELLIFRREFLSLPYIFAGDIAYLRGSQEEMWQKLLQLQFASDPRGVLGWMLEQGLGPTLGAYGISPDDGLREARAGPMQLTRWTSRLRRTIQEQPGHYELLGALRRAAHTGDGKLLFVNAGIDPTRPIETQKDTFWWVSSAFGKIEKPYAGYRRVIRGFAPEHPGLQLGAHTATVDAGCGFGGPLIAVCFMPSGEVADQLEA